MLRVLLITALVLEIVFYLFIDFLLASLNDVKTEQKEGCPMTKSFSIITLKSLLTLEYAVDSNLYSKYSASLSLLHNFIKNFFT